ncbi:endo-1,4-beta-xylanase [Rufibacter glacialis]|uniref:Beta-xylanase n=1 Tax=Rufibacter glacialis TaxID=1259555 RepID=A0ABV4RJX5_9BACT|nr:endo-1,4-beta-xylanase [Rufibacter glacialis]GGK88734.1 beta-xylanase [Rufibacter glacialis]
MPHLYRLFLLTLAFCGLQATSHAQTGPIAQGKPKFLGNIFSSAQLPGFNQYWNQVVPENAGKWGSVENTRDVMNWTELDAAYKLAKDNGYPFRMHVLVWGNQQPAWIETLSSAEQLEEIKVWFEAVAQRYPAIDFLEVVNEPINDPPTTPGSGGGNYAKALGGSGASGWEWVVASFRLARQYFPKTTKLMINEYSLTNSSSRAATYVGIINLLKAENLIDAVGIQGHYFSTKGIANPTLTSNLNLIAATNLPIYITEMDIDDRAGTQPPANQTVADQYQLDEYKRIFPLFWEHPSVRGITLWGYRPGMWRTEQGANLIRSNGEERPALTWLRAYVAATLTASKEEALPTWQVYPNPVTQQRLIFTGLGKKSLLSIVDMKGTLLKKMEVKGLAAQEEIALDLPPGMYILRVQQGDLVATRKVVVQ